MFITLLLCCCMAFLTAFLIIQAVYISMFGWRDGCREATQDFWEITCVYFTSPIMILVNLVAIAIFIWW